MTLTLDRPAPMDTMDTITVPDTVPPATHRLRISGGVELTWDPAVAAEVHAARGAFGEMRGYLAYRIDDDGVRTQMHRFDPAAGEIVMTPPLVGG